MFHASCSLESQVSGIKLHKAGTGVDARRKDKRIRRHQVVEFGELIRQGWRVVGRGGSNHVHLEDS
jgi:hypothetical protein